MSFQVLGIDPGNYKTKIVHESGLDQFLSPIGEWRKRNAGESHSKLDMEFEIVNKYDSFRGFCGPLASIESEYGGTVFGSTKNHIDAKTRTLLAIHRNLQQQDVKIVVGQPYKGHTDTEKEEIISSLMGEWTVTINGNKKEFVISDVSVGIEGAMAFLSAPFSGPVNIIDVGSGTVNCIHFNDKRIVDLRSDTLLFGSETNKDGVNFEGMASGIFKGMSARWNKDHPTFVCGGTAKDMVMPLKRYYKSAEVLPCRANINGIKISVDVEYANAVGMYIAGVKNYAKLQVS
jgi:plasmid segregation protein ParM